MNISKPKKQQWLKQQNLMASCATSFYTHQHLPARQSNILPEEFSLKFHRGDFEIVSNSRDHVM